MAKLLGHVDPRSQHSITPSPPAPIPNSSVVGKTMSTPIGNEASAQVQLNNKWTRASKEVELKNQKTLDNEGAATTSIPEHRTSAASSSFSRPDQGPETTGDSSDSDDEVEAQSSIQSGVTYKESSFVDEYAKKQQSVYPSKPAKGQDKAMTGFKANSKITDISSDEDVDENDLSPPKSAQAKAPKTKPSRIPNPDADIQAFLDGLPNIRDWTSTTGIHSDYCKIIEWLDKDKLCMEEVVARWQQLPDRLSYGDNPDKNMYKHYEKWAPKFYAEKGLVFASRGDRRKYAAARKSRVAGKSAPNRTRVTKLATKSESNGGKGKKRSAAPLPAQSNNSPAGPRVEQELTVSTNSRPQPSRSLNFQGSDSPSTNGRDADHLLAANKEDSKQSSMSLPSQDEQLERLFAQVPPYTDTRSADLFPRKKKTQAKPIIVAADAAAQISHTKRPSAEDITRYSLNRNSANVLHFKCAAGDAMLGHPSRPVLDLNCAQQYSEYLLACVHDSPNLQLIEYDDSIKDATIARLVACVSPSLRKDLPTYDFVEIRKGELRATVIQWSMQELKDLYVLARELHMWDVVDMVMDRIHTELHRPAPRVYKDEGGERKAFDVLEFSPGFLKHLSEYDAQGTHFFTDILVMLGQAGWSHMCKYDLKLWTPEIKQMLINKIQDDPLDPIVSIWDADFICQEYHHHHGHDRACYKEQDPAPPVVDVAPPLDPSKKQHMLDPAASDCQRNAEVQAIEQQEPHPAADDLQDKMHSLSLSTFSEPTYAPSSPVRPIAPPAAHPDEHPAFPGGFIYPKDLGNQKKDNKRQQLGKMALIKKKLAEFKRAGYEVGDIGDVEMSGEEDGGGEEEGSSDGDEQSAGDGV